MNSISSRLTALENRPGNKIPYFSVETADGATSAAYGYGLLSMPDVVRVCYDPAQPCAREVVGLFAALYPETEVTPNVQY